MRIIHLSDTHSRHKELPQLPEADVIVHSGDFTLAGTEEEAYDFMNWFCDLPYNYKIFIAGNHDMCMYGAEKIEGLPDNVHYLCNSSVVIDSVRFYGIPMFVEDCINGIYDSLFDNIPVDTDILITHQPPQFVCDAADYGDGIKNHGNQCLYERVNQLHLRYHLFGHEHDAYGITKRSKTVFSNAAVMDNQYQLIRKPRLFVFSLYREVDTKLFFPIGKK